MTGLKFSPFLCILSTSFLFTPHALEERDAFSIPLPNLFVRFDNRSRNLDEVFISYDNENEGWAITNFNDRYTKFTSKRQIDHEYIEHRNTAYLLSDFEAQQINKICESFVITLTLFDRYLQEQRWGRLLYLDVYFPPFFQGFYFLMQAAQCSQDFLPRITCIADSLFDKSINSAKSDRRIQYWRENPAHLTKLRIVTKELIFQTRQWQEKELNKAKRSNYLYSNLKFKEIYELFIRFYFNLSSFGSEGESVYHAPTQKNPRSVSAGQD